PEITAISGIDEVLAQFGGMVPLREQIDKLRWVKSKTEQKLMRATCDVGGRAMNAMIARSKGVRNENEIVGRLEMESRRRGGAWLAYPPVVAAANRANTIHYLDCSQPINEGDVVLVDAGCEVHGYVSDITRVFPAGGHFSSAQRALCDALNDLHSQLLRIVENVRPLRLNNLYMAMVEAMSKILLEIGLFPSIISGQELMHETDKICPHHVSHYLGMDVHDTASVPRNISLVPGVTFTVEPGFYVRKDNEVAREDFRGIGMRIEDDILMTDDGMEVLTRHCARESADIERLMKF
uniref:Aminopeptidase P N-terminal domain-containing protein n=1 Tax=Parascaris univalens TaxID=6257 RepID=A0A915AFY4_PARUN